MNEAEPMMLWLPSLTGSDKLEGLQGPPLASFLVLRNVTRRFSSSRSFLFPSSQSLHPNLPPAHATLTNVTPYLHQARWRRLDLLICIFKASISTALYLCLLFRGPLSFTTQLS
jgi:hypothetical protein